MDRVLHKHRQYNNAITDVPGGCFFWDCEFHPGTDGLNDLKYNSKQIGSFFQIDLDILTPKHDMGDVHVFK